MSSTALSLAGLPKIAQLSLFLYSAIVYYQQKLFDLDLLEMIPPGYILFHAIL